MPSTGDLLEAVIELRRGITELVVALENDYAKRQEIEDRFTTKGSSWKKFWVGMLVATLMLLTSFFASVSTTAICFLGQPPQPSICSAIPGYDEATERNDGLIKEFRQLQEAINRLGNKVK